VAYNQGQLTLIFNTILWVSQPSVANNQITIVYVREVGNNRGYVVESNAANMTLQNKEM